MRIGIKKSGVIRHLFSKNNPFKIYHVWSYRWLETAVWLASPPGDVNNDRVVDLSDAVLIMKVMAGMEISGGTLDVSAGIMGTGRLGMADAVLAMQFMAGLSIDAEINPLGMIDDKGRITLREVIYILQNIAGMR